MLASDLVATGFRAEVDTFFVSYDINNEDATSFEIAIYRSYDGTNLDEQITTHPVTDPGDLDEATGHEIPITADISSDSDDYHLLVVLDSLAEVSETDESNNTYTLDYGGLLKMFPLVF